MIERVCIGRVNCHFVDVAVELVYLLSLEQVLHLGNVSTWLIRDIEYIQAYSQYHLLQVAEIFFTQ
jgi:hypothetical protein